MEKVDKTALYVLVWKNEGSDYSAPIYKRDPYMRYFFNPTIENEAKAVGGKPASYRAVQIRRKHIKHTISADLKSAQPSSQIILLGAGLDTLPMYKAKKWPKLVPDLHFFEIDKNDVIDYKQTVIQRHNLPNPSLFIKADYTHDNFIDVLEKHGVNFQVKTHIIWEGNTFYIDLNQIVEVLKKLREAFAAVPLLITFDYFGEEIIQKKANSESMEKLQDEFEKIGAKFKTGFKDIKAFAEKNGFEVILNDNIPTLDKKYFNEKAPIPEAEDQFYYICTMQNISTPKF